MAAINKAARNVHKLRARLSNPQNTGKFYIRKSIHTSLPYVTVIMGMKQMITDLIDLDTVYTIQVTICCLVMHLASTDIHYNLKPKQSVV